MFQNQRTPKDLIVFLAVLATGITLTLFGVPAGQLATISIALTGLYNAWTGTAHHNSTTDDTPRTPEALTPPDPPVPPHP